MTRSSAAALTRRHPLLALRLRLAWSRETRARDRATLSALRSGSPVLLRISPPAGRCGLAELEFGDGRLVYLTGVNRRVACTLDAALGQSLVELTEGAHPGPVWALYFRIVGESGADRVPMLALSAQVAPGSGPGGPGSGSRSPIRPCQLVPA